MGRYYMDGTILRARPGPVGFSDWDRKIQNQVGSLLNAGASVEFESGLPHARYIIHWLSLLGKFDWYDFTGAHRWIMFAERRPGVLHRLRWIWPLREGPNGPFYEWY